MPTGAGESELGRLLRDALTVRFAAAGWQADTARSGPDPWVASFHRPLTEDFQATAGFIEAFDAPDDASLVVDDVEVGVSYEPLRRLWPLLADFGGFDEVAESVGNLMDPQRKVTVAVNSPSDVAKTADRLTELVLQHSGEFVARNASVDAVLAFLRRPDPELEEIDDPKERELFGRAAFEQESTSVPALLAAAGRLEHARAELAEYSRADHWFVRSREYRRFARQLNRWLDAEGTLPPVPPAPPTGRPEPPSFGASVRRARAERDASEAVRRAAGGKTRDELRVILIAELGRRGLDRPPSWIEGTLDQIEASPLGRLVGQAKGLKTLGELGMNMFKMLRDDIQDSDRGDPEWLEPPERAGYPGPTGREEWVAVQLDQGSAQFLGRVHLAARHWTSDVVSVEPWLAWDPEPRTPESRLSVHIGEQQVGYIDGQSVPRYDELMDAAAARDELPWLTGRLVSRPSPPEYLLEIPVPPQRTAAQVPEPPR